MLSIYTNEFLKAIESIERDLMATVRDWSYQINMDYMVESKNLSIGDTDDFESTVDDGFFVKMEVHQIDCYNEIKLLQRESIHKVSNRLSKIITKTLNDLLEEKISKHLDDSCTIKDARKMVKIVLESDMVMIDYQNNKLLFKFGIGVQKPKF